MMLWWILRFAACVGVVLAQTNASLQSVRSLQDSWTPPLSTRGRFVVDASGKRFRLKAGNFHGASGTYNGRGDYNDPANHHAGELAYQTVLGLDRKPLDDIINDFLRLGINSVRLPFSNAMIHATAPVPDRGLTANQDLRNLTPLQVFDRVVAALTRRGIAVILNNHTVLSLWCCGLDRNARWNGAQSTDQWVKDWIFMVSRYRDNPRVVGAALYNEVRRDLLLDPSWGGGRDEDWYSASMTAATRIQREASKDILIIVEGINWVGIPIPALPHYRPELDPVKQLSHALPYPDKLVYSSHFYAYTGANATGADTGFGATKDPTYAELSPANLRQTFHTLAGYVATAISDVQQHFTAPVWISEFGVGGRNEFSQLTRQWWNQFTDILNEQDLDFAVWPLVGWQERGQGDLWALNAYSSAGQLLSILDPGDWRLDGWRKLVQGAASGNDTVPPVEKWTMLAPDWGSQQQSNWLAQRQFTKPSDKGASCPDGLRLHGLSHSEDPRGLCTDAKFGRQLWTQSDTSAVAVAVTTEAHVTGSDWAKTFTKLQCPASNFLVGYSYTQSFEYTAICAPMAKSPAGSAGGRVGRRTVWFDRDSSPDAERHGRFAGNGVLLGTCADDEVLTGFAYTTRKESAGPAALLCENYNASATVQFASSNSAWSSRNSLAHNFAWIHLSVVFALLPLLLLS